MAPNTLRDPMIPCGSSSLEAVWSMLAMKKLVVLLNSVQSLSLVGGYDVAALQPMAGF